MTSHPPAAPMAGTCPVPQGLPTDTPPDLATLRDFVVRLERRASAVESCRHHLADALRGLEWRSDAGVLARTRFDTELAAMNKDVADLRFARLALQEHITSVETVHRNLTAAQAGVAPDPACVVPSAFRMH